MSDNHKRGFFFNVSTHLLFLSCSESSFYVYFSVDIHSFPSPEKCFRLTSSGLLDARRPFTSHLRYRLLLGVSFCKYGSCRVDLVALHNSGGTLITDTPRMSETKTINWDQYTHPRIHTINEETCRISKHNS